LADKFFFTLDISG